MEISLTGGMLEANVEQAIETALPRALKRHLADPTLVELQLAERVAERLSKWLKYIGVPAGALIAAFSLFGLQTSLDMSRSHERVQSSIGQLQQRTDAATKSLVDAERIAETARNKANSATKQSEVLEVQLAQARDTLAKAQQVVNDLATQRRELAALRSQVDDIKKLLIAPPKTQSRSTAVDKLARTMWGEARGNGVEGMEAVAAVVANRANLGFLRATTVEEVCLQPWQFPSWNANNPDRLKILAANTSDPIFQVALGIAERTIDGKLQDRTAGATHYHLKNNVVEPRWADKNLVTVIVGSYIFYRMLT